MLSCTFLSTHIAQSIKMFSFITINKQCFSEAWISINTGLKFYLLLCKIKKKHLILQLSMHDLDILIFILWNKYMSICEHYCFSSSIWAFIYTSLIITYPKNSIIKKVMYLCCHILYISRIHILKYQNTNYSYFCNDIEDNIFRCKNSKEFLDMFLYIFFKSVFSSSVELPQYSGILAVRSWNSQKIII